MNYLYVILSSLMFGIAPSIQNLALVNNASANDVIFYCSLFSCLVSFAYCKIQNISIKLNKKQLLSIFIAGVMGLFITDYCLDIAYTLLPVGLVTTIHFTYPCIVCITNTLLFKEKMDLSRIISIVLSAAGLILLGSSSLSSNVKGIIITMISACAFSLFYILNERSQASSVDDFVKTFYFGLFSTIAASLLNLTSHSQLTGNPKNIFFLFLAGVTLLLGNVFLSKGINKVGSSSASLISTLEPITSLLVSCLLYRYELSSTSIIGSILIIASLFPTIIKQKIQ